MRVVLEKDLATNTFGEQSRLYARAVVERFNEALSTRGMDLKRANVIAFLIDEPLQLCTEWLNHYIKRYKLYAIKYVIDSLNMDVLGRN